MRIRFVKYQQHHLYIIISNMNMSILFCDNTVHSVIVLCRKCSPSRTANGQFHSLIEVLINGQFLQGTIQPLNASMVLANCSLFCNSFIVLSDIQFLNPCVKMLGLTIVIVFVY